VLQILVMIHDGFRLMLRFVRGAEYAAMARFGSCA
jgi:hypothetical protein